MKVQKSSTNKNGDGRHEPPPPATPPRGTLPTLARQEMNRAITF